MELMDLDRRLQSSLAKLTPEQPTLSVIAPCLNEEENIDTLVTRTLETFNRHHLSGELVLIDDGSTDCTWDKITKQMSDDCRVRGVRHKENRGMELAWKSGLSKSRGKLVCLIDADLQNQPEDIAQLLSAYEIAGKDLIQAIRCPVSGLRRWQFFSRGLNLLLNMAFNMRSRDNKSGFILCSREVMHRLLSHRFSYRYFQNFIGASAKANGFSMGEVDTLFDRRHRGASFLSRYPIVTSMKIFKELIKFRIETWFASRAMKRSGQQITATTTASAKLTATIQS